MIVLFFTLFIEPIYSKDTEKISINKMIILNKLDYEYDRIKNKIIIKNKDKAVTILLDSSYILLDNTKFYLNELLIVEQGDYLITKRTNKIILNYLSIISNNEENIIVKKGDDNIIDSNSFYLNHKIIEKNELNFTKNNFENNKYDEIADENNNGKQNDHDKYIHEIEPDELKINAIIIDPGHGGYDPGAVGYSGTKEKDIVLKTSLILRDKLKKLYPDKKIIITRDKDEFISLEKRANIANYVFDKYGYSIFISIHVNASRSSKSYGFETWYLVEEYRRNIVKKGEISEDSDVENVINSMLNDEIYKESRYLSKKIQSNLEDQIGYTSRNRGIKEQTYFVIKKSIMPAVLVEIGFNTNKYEEIRLTKYEYLNKITDGIQNGVREFIYEYERTKGFTK